MEIELKAKEIHEYYMSFLKSEYKGISIPKELQEAMIVEIILILEKD